MSHVGITPAVGEELSVAAKHPDEAVRTEMQPRLREALAPIRQPEYAEVDVTAMLEEIAWPAEHAPLTFVCGPTRMVESVASMLVGLGYDPARVKTERFGPTGGAS